MRGGTARVRQMNRGKRIDHETSLGAGFEPGVFVARGAVRARTDPSAGAAALLCLDRLSAVIARVDGVR